MEKNVSKFLFSGFEVYIFMFVFDTFNQNIDSESVEGDFFLVVVVAAAYINWIDSVLVDLSVSPCHFLVKGDFFFFGCCCCCCLH